MAGVLRVVDRGEADVKLGVDAVVGHDEQLPVVARQPRIVLGRAELVVIPHFIVGYDEVVISSRGSTSTSRCSTRHMPSNKAPAGAMSADGRESPSARAVA